MNRYAYTIDLASQNSSWATLIRWTGRGRRVLDVGCGRGQMGSILHEKFGCAVTGIEINPEFARECTHYDRVLIGSVENESLLDQLEGKFDVILCGDVLEHLRGPGLVLRAFHRLLTPEGRLLISVPNVAQFRIRWMLLRGRWDYTAEGIMDETHLRWFTLKTLRALVAQCGWKEMGFTFTLSPNLGKKLDRFPGLKKLLPPTLFAAQFLLNLSRTESSLLRR